MTQHRYYKDQAKLSAQARKAAVKEVSKGPATRLRG